MRARACVKPHVRAGMSRGSSFPTPSGYEISHVAWYVSFMRAALAFTFVLLACSTSETTDAGDAGVDTGVIQPKDATIDTYVDPVAVCKAEATRVANLCGSSAQRKCFFQQYGELCLLERNTVMTTALKCFDMGCHTFADPGTMAIEACLKKVAADNTMMFADKAKTAYCAKCPTASGCNGQGLIVLPFETLSDSRNDQTAMCADNAADCAGADACLAVEFPDVFACFGTPKDGGTDAASDAASDAAKD